MNEIELRGQLPPETVKPREGYKETKLIFMSNGIVVQNNNDVEFTDDILMGLHAGVYAAHCNRIDSVLEKWGGESSRGPRENIRKQNKEVPRRRRSLVHKILGR